MSETHTIMFVESLYSTVAAITTYVYDCVCAEHGANSLRHGASLGLFLH